MRYSITLSVLRPAAIVTAATVIAWWLDQHVSLAVLAMLYIAAVALASSCLPRAGSAVTAILAVLALNFFFVEPRYTLMVGTEQHVLTLIAMFGTAALVNTLSTRLRTAAKHAEEREIRARGLQHLAAELAALDHTASIIEAAQQAMVASLGGPAAIVLTRRGEPVHSLPPDAALFDADALAHCTQTQQALGPGTGRWDELPCWYLPLRAGADRLGAVGIPVLGHAEEDREHAQAIADLLAGAIRRADHAAEANAARSAAEAEQLRNTLLASLAHDFRTPLASLLGAVSSLQAQHERLSEADRAKFLDLIGNEARYLNTISENTLQWARLAAPHPVLRLDWESVEEIIGSTLARVRPRDPQHRLRVLMPPGLPLVRADAVLLAQLLDNLLDNALRYSDAPIALETSLHHETLHVDVLDHGPGIAESDLERIFQTFYRGPNARHQRGAGIGLAVCRAIASAHGGSLTAQRRDGGGMRFTLMLPVAPPPASPMEAGAT